MPLTNRSTPRVSEAMHELLCPLCQTRSVARTAEGIPRVGGAREHWVLRCWTCPLCLVHPDVERLMELWDALTWCWSDEEVPHEP
jgi:hypothetical protein